MYLSNWNGCIGEFSKAQKSSTKYLIDLLIILQDLIMYWNAVGPHRYGLNNLANFGGRFIYMDNKHPTAYNNVCERYIKILLRNVSVIVALMILSHAMLIFGPLYAYYFQSIRLTPIATNLPYFEKDSDIEFGINLSIQAVMALLALAGSMSIEVVACLILNVVTIIPDLIQVNLIELADDVFTNGLNLNTIARLRNVLIQIQDFDGYKKFVPLNSEIHFIIIYI